MSADLQNAIECTGSARSTAELAASCSLETDDFVPADVGVDRQLHGLLGWTRRAVHSLLNAAAVHVRSTTSEPQGLHHICCRTLVQKSPSCILRIVLSHLMLPYRTAFNRRSMLQRKRCGACASTCPSCSWPFITSKTLQRRHPGAFRSCSELWQAAIEHLSGWVRIAAA